jgi:transcription elongation GreA/GreB family factor
MNKGEGDVAEVVTPGGRKELEIVSFRTIHDKEAEGSLRD